MTTLADIYRPSLALATDLYQLTMAYGYWKAGLAQHEAVFHLSFRHNPFGGGYTIAAGQALVRDFVTRLSFTAEDCAYLASLTGNDGRPLFEPAFCDLLAELRPALEVEALAEGTAVFPFEPILRVRGPMLQAQIVETPLLCLINFQTLIATKAARVVAAARGEPVLEFGLRRAQGLDGALGASRAAYIGGCAATSNLLAGRLFGIPVRGTHAHSWVMSFDSELEAFQAYADAMPNNCVFLVDTYDTLAGVRHAIEVARQMRGRGQELIGVRLDSGDLAYLSVQARRLLDAAGFEKATIVASNDLDEQIIESLKQQGAAIGLWGVGTKLVTAFDQPALGGVYKLSALRAPGGAWRHRVKLSEQTIKTSIPGMLQVRRFSTADGALCDLIFDELLGIPAAPTLVDPLDGTRRRTVAADLTGRDLLQPLARGDRAVATPESLTTVRERVQRELATLHAGIRRFLHPHQYPVGLEQRLFELRTELILEARGARA
jgi:nicotinate phosphoribosyltransferase